MTEKEKAIELYKRAYSEYYDLAQSFGYTDAATHRQFAIVDAYEEMLIEVFDLNSNDIDKIEKEIRDGYTA